MSRGRGHRPKGVRPPRNPAPEGGSPDFVSRALARAGVLAPGEVEPALRAGRITLNGRKIQVPFTPLPPGADLRLDGHRVDISFKTRVLLFHKPEGVVTAKDDKQRQGTVFDVLLPLLPPHLKAYGWHAVGRLDRNTTGLLLFSNDERFVAYATSPQSRLPKRYLARVYGELTDQKLEPLRQGMHLDDGKARPAKARVRSPQEVEVTLTEGRFHQVKRMLGAVGLPVAALHREAIGSVELDIEQGGFRELTDDELRQGLGYGA